jgi:pyrophosphate--fructose-6-phosphate 1-phosphotransferase
MQLSPKWNRGVKRLARDTFRHVKLDSVNPRDSFKSQFAKKVELGKRVTQKSEYFASSASSHLFDIALIYHTAQLALKSVLTGESDVIELDEKHDWQMGCMDFDRIKGGKRFDLAKNSEFMSLRKQTAHI